MKKFLLKLLMGTSLTASVFVFQACYGPADPGEYDESRLEGLELSLTEPSSDAAIGIEDEASTDREAEGLPSEE